MANPLLSERTQFSRTPFGDMTNGESRTFNFTSEKVQSASITVTRTNRDFSHDWIDAANSIRTNRAYVWVPDSAGGAKLVAAKKF